MPRFRVVVMVTAKEPEDGSLRKSAQQLLRKMLLVWCRETVAIGILPHRGGESDKRVVVRRERGGEFGFRIHGSRPVVVSAIEAGTPAESSGLEVGDIVLSVNGAPVLDASHSEVVKIAHAGSDTLELEVARTCDVLTPVLRSAGIEGIEAEWGDLEGMADMLLAGYLWKMATSGAGVGRWHRRWFCLRRNHCLYYYKSEEEVQPLGALALADYSVEILESKKTATEEAGEDTGWEPPYAFRVWRRGALGLTLGTESVDSGKQWSRALGMAIERSSQGDAWLEEVERWVGLGPGAITRPDCFGYLSYLQPTEGTERSSSVGGTGRRRGKSAGAVSGTGEWRRRYCVLKDACLFFYDDVDSRSAVGMACLHGYRVQSSSPAVGPPGAVKRLFAFEVLPPLAPSPTSDHHHHHHHHHGGHHRHHATGQRHVSPYHQKHFHFHTDTEMDKKRWLAALEYSIDRWIKVG